MVSFRRSRHLLVEWILESWNRLDKSLIINSFKSCALNLKSDGSEDHLIHCFKDNQPCATGSNMLKEQQNLLMKAEHLNSNPFQITELYFEKKYFLEQNFIFLNKRPSLLNAPLQ